MDRTCKQCGALLPPLAPEGRLYCSPRCKRIARDRRNGVQPKSPRFHPGDRFGKLVLVQRAPEVNGRQHWFCDCDCGTKNFEARADKLRDGRQKSCGCINAELQRQYRKQRKERLEELEQKRIALQAKVKPPTFDEQKLRKRHESVKKCFLVPFKVPPDDPLCHFNYYAAIVADGCTYCRGPLPETGAPFDVIDESTYECAATVVPACWACIDRRKNMHDRLTYEEMLIVGSALELVRLQRDVV